MHHHGQTFLCERGSGRSSSHRFHLHTQLAEHEARVRIPLRHVTKLQESVVEEGDEERSATEKYHDDGDGEDHHLHARDEREDARLHVALNNFGGQRLNFERNEIGGSRCCDHLVDVGRGVERGEHNNRCECDGGGVGGEEEHAVDEVVETILHDEHLQEFFRQRDAWETLVHAQCGDARVAEEDAFETRQAVLRPEHGHHEHERRKDDVETDGEKDCVEFVCHQVLLDGWAAWWLTCVRHCRYEGSCVGLCFYFIDLWQMF